MSRDDDMRGQAIMHAHQRVHFFSTVDLVNGLEQEKLAGRQGQIPDAKSLATMAIVGGQML